MAVEKSQQPFPLRHIPPPLRRLMQKPPPEKSMRGWVVRERPEDAAAFLFLFGFLSIAVFVISALSAALLWFVADRSVGLVLWISMMASAAVAALAFTAGARTSRSASDWRPGEFTFAAWPIRLDEATSVTYELRRKNITAAHPGLRIELLLQHLDVNRNRISRFRTTDRVRIEPTEERRIEPVSLRFQLVIPPAWSAAAASPDHKVLLQVWKHGERGAVAYPVELKLTPG